MCLTTEGMLLEWKTYLTCKALMDERVGDCATGVTIDWDGINQTANNSITYNGKEVSAQIVTINEIDVMAVFGLEPFFISCKNGRFTADELYKLNTVSQRFGKGYGRCILVCTNISYSLGRNKDLLLQRAKDMNIKIIANVNKMTDDEFSNALSVAMELPKLNNNKNMR